MFFKNNFDFVAIGDTTIDAFIRIKEASVNCDINKENCQICLDYGNKIPYESVTVIPAVGNSANAAIAAARLGLSSALVANIGDDYHGKEALDALAVEKVSTEFVRVNAGEKTNYHYVLWFEDDRTILVKHEEYNYKLPDIDDPRWVYLSSLGSNSLSFHHEIEKYLHDNSEVKLAFNPGNY